MKASDNPFPSILVEETAAPAAPPAGSQRLFIDPVDHLLKTIDSAGTISTIGSGGGGGGGGSTGFTDDFTAADAALDTYNGWTRVGSVAAGQNLVIASNKVQSDAYLDGTRVPYLHPYTPVDPNVADVSVDVGRADTAGFSSLLVCSDAAAANYLMLEWDSSDHTSTGLVLNVMVAGTLTAQGWDVDHANFPGFTAGSGTLRCTYNNTTHAVQVFFNGVLCYEITDLSVYDVLPALATMNNVGLCDTSSVVADQTFDHLVCV